jgi:hypothetical protein
MPRGIPDSSGVIACANGVKQQKQFPLNGASSLEQTNFNEQNFFMNPQNAGRPCLPLIDRSRGTMASRWPGKLCRQ